MDAFPAVVPLQGLTVVVVGDGDAADAKARLFDGSPATLRRIAAGDALEPHAYAGARLVFLALPPATATAAAALARAAGALVNVVDRPALCDFNTPAIIDRGAVVGAIATGGAAPVLASELRGELEARWPQGLGEVARLLRALQDEVRAALPDVAERRSWLRRELLDGSPATLAMAGKTEAAIAEARARLATPSAREGRLWGLAPPSSLDLLTLRALRVLGRADRVVVAQGVDPALAALARRDAPRTALADIAPHAVAAEVAAGASVVCIGPPAAFQGFGAMMRLTCAPEAGDTGQA